MHLLSHHLGSLCFMPHARLNHHSILVAVYCLNTKCIIIIILNFSRFNSLCLYVERCTYSLQSHAHSAVISWCLCLWKVLHHLTRIIFGCHHQFYILIIVVIIFNVITTRYSVMRNAEYYELQAAVSCAGKENCQV